MARILPGSLGSTFSGVERARELREGAVDYARAPDTPHGFDALAKTLQHPLTGIATSAISRIGDEIAYAGAVDEEKERLDKAQFEYQQAQEQAQNAARYRQQLEQQAQDPMLQAAIRGAQAYEGPPPPVDLGHAGGVQTGMTSTGMPTTTTYGAVGQPTAPGYRQYSHEDLLGMQGELEQARQLEAQAMQALGPAPQERFVPRTVAEFQFAIANEPDPQRRQELLMQARRAVDVQPGSVEEAIKGTAGARAQKATRGAGVQAQKTRHEQAAKREDLLRRREEFDFDRDYKEAQHALKIFSEESKAGKRASEVKLNEAKLKKFNRRMAASIRRRGAPDWFKTFIKDEHGGDFASAVKKGDKFWSGLHKAAPGIKDFKAVRKMVAQHLKDSGLDDEASAGALNSELRIAGDEVRATQRSFNEVKREAGVAESDLEALRPQIESVLGMDKDPYWGEPERLPSDYWRKEAVLDAIASSDMKGGKEFYKAVKSARSYDKRLENAEANLNDARGRFKTVVGKSKKKGRTYETTVQPQGQPQGVEIIGEYLVEAE